MDQNEHELTIDDLAERTGISIRTIRFYIAEDLLPGPGSRGKGANYTEEHLLRLSLIRLLAEQHMPLAEMRDLLGRLSLPEVQALAAEQAQQIAELVRASQAPSPKDYVSKLLNRAKAQKNTSGPRPNKQPSAPGQASSPPAVERGVYPQRARRAVPGEMSETWVRWQVLPGVELHVQAEVATHQPGMIEELYVRLMEMARQLGR